MHHSLSTGHLLSPLVREDRQAIFEHLQERAIYERTLLIPWPYTLEHADQFIDLMAKETETHGHPLNWAIREPTGHFIGDIGLTLGGPGRDHAAAIGYWLAKPHWGKGIVTSAVSAVVEHAFNHLQLERIAATIFSGNAASGRVLEKAGFQLEAAHLRHAYRKDGRFIDGCLYARVKAP
ncbi:MAG: GNAT family N-acetyltransferase [Prosthecobacter sp.]|nr:GNAT family N-acetyltransferase [Prosthecobacter sp.]